MKFHSIVPIALLSVILASMTAHAAFFMRIRSSALQAMKSTGGKVVSKADAVINGRDSKLTIVGFDKTMAEAASDLRRLWKIPDITSDRSLCANGAWLTSEEDGVRCDVVFFPGNSYDSCSAWLMESDASAVTSLSQSVPGGNPLPGAELKSCIQLKSSGTVLTLHESTGDVFSSARNVESTMGALGWETLLSNDTTSFFAKDGHAAAALSYQGEGSRVRTVVVRTECGK